MLHFPILASETAAAAAEAGDSIIKDATYFQQQLERFADACVDIAYRLIAALAVLAIGIFLIRFLLKYISRGKGLTHMDLTVKKFLFSFTRISLYALLLISVIAIMGVPMTSVVAVLASVGVTVGLALQGSLSNLAGGIMILIFKPFRVGNYIDSAGGSGTVVEVSLFYTILRSPTNERISVPNASLSNTKITNFSIYDTRRLDLSFPAAFGSDKNAVITTIMSVVDANPKVKKEPAPFLRLTEYSGSGFVFTLRVWCASPDLGNLKSDLLEDVYEALARAGIEVPYQTISVSIKK